MLIVPFKSLRNSKRRNKGNFTSKSNSNKIELCGVGGQHLTIGERPYKKNIESLNLTRKVNILRL